MDPLQNGMGTLFKINNIYLQMLWIMIMKHYAPEMRDVRAERAYPFSFFDLGFAKLPIDPRS